MAKTKEYIAHPHSNGNILISRDVIATIIINAVREVEGVAGLTGLGKRSWNKAIRIVITPKDNLGIECNLTVYYGNNLVDVANAAQQTIANAIFAMTGIKAKAVHVNVNNVVMQK